MAYSRWSDSCWYTYGNADKANTFSICMVADFTYDELKKDINKCLKIAKEKSEKKDIFGNSKKVNKKELLELKKYMNWFIEDIEDKEYLK